MNDHATTPELRLDRRQQRLLRHDTEVPLRPKAFEVLCHLVEHGDRLVTKDELLDAVWGHAAGCDELLRGCIFELRQALADDPKDPRYVETVPRRGYRFVGDIATVDGPWTPPDPLPETPPEHLLGRRAEMAQLWARLERAYGGEREVTIVGGDIGIGKTALVEAFLAQVRGCGGDLCIAHGQCQELYGKGEAYMPVLEALERLCRQPRGRGLLEHLRRHAPTWLLQLPALLDDDEHAALCARAAGSNPARMLREIALALEAYSLDAPLVLVLEDLHWSDAATLDLVAALARRREPARLLVIGTHRQAVGREAPPGPLGHLCRQGRCCHLPLRGLTRSAIEQYLARELSGGEAFGQRVGPLVELVYRLTGGNPLFLVTMVEDLLERSYLVDDGEGWRLHRRVEDTGVAGSLQQMIEERLEDLDAEDRRLLEVASVVGPELSALAAAAALEMDVAEVEERYDELVRRGQFLRATGVEQWPDGRLAGRYAFTHTLYCSVIYRRTAAAKRLRLHRRIGEALAAGYRDRPEEVAAVLAMHFGRGRDYRRAVESHVLAARKALRRSAHREALDHLGQGLDLLRFLPDDAERRRQELELYSSFGLALVATQGYGVEEVGLVYARAHELQRQLCQGGSQLSARWGVAVFHLMRAEYGESRAMGEDCLREGEARSDAALRMLGHRLLGMTAFHRGELLAARRHLELSLELYKDLRSAGGDAESLPGAYGLGHLGPVMWLLGYPDQALERCGEALDLARRLGDPQSLACARHFVALVHQLRGEADEAEVQARLTHDLSTEQGFPLWQACSRLVLGWRRALGDPQQAIPELREALTTWEAMRSKSWSSGFSAILAAAQAHAGRFEEAQVTLAEGLDAVRRHGEHWNEPELLRLEGARLWHRGSGDHARAEERFRRALDLARAQGAVGWELRAANSLARLLLRAERADEARRVLAGVRERFDEGPTTADVQRADGLLARLPPSPAPSQAPSPERSPEPAPEALLTGSPPGL